MTISVLCRTCEGTGLLLRSDCPQCLGDGACIGFDAPPGLPFDGKPRRWPWRPPLRPRSSLCLVLDIDGTLLSEAARVSGPTSMRFLLRPHLDEFLEFAFQSFSGVALWTAGSRGWLEAFLNAVDPQRQRPWAFTWSYERVSMQCVGTSVDSNTPVFQYVKRLRKIWQNKGLRAKGFSPHTTLIVDNNPSVCIPNYGNAIYIKTYGDYDPEHDRYDSAEDDDWLLALIEYLRHLNTAKVPGETVRHIEKRDWYAQAQAKLKQDNLHGFIRLVE